MRKHLSVFWLFFASWQEAKAFEISFDRYHSQNFINRYLLELEILYPDLVIHRNLGESQMGREISMIIMGKNIDLSEKRPAIYLNGTHHGNEKSSTEAVLAVIDHLIRNRNQQPVNRILKKFHIFLQPLVNPDGHARNSRFSSTGFDPNRDYATPRKPESESFTLKETRLVKSLLETRRFIGSIAYHSGVEAIFWPWCFSRERNKGTKLFRSIAAIMADSMGFSYFQQSYNDYKTDGEFIDYAFMKYGTYAMTLEVSREHTPSPRRLRYVMQRTVKGTLSFIESIEKILKPTKIAAGQ